MQRGDRKKTVLSAVCSPTSIRRDRVVLHCRRASKANCENCHFQPTLTVYSSGASHFQYACERMYTWCVPDMGSQFGGCEYGHLVPGVGRWAGGHYHIWMFMFLVPSPPDLLDCRSCSSGNCWSAALPQHCQNCEQD